MKQLQRIASLFLVVMVLFCCMSGVVAKAAPTTNVNFRLVLAKYMSYASCSVYLERYDSMSAKTAIESTQISIGRTDLWEREVALEPGYYEVVYVSVNGAWDSIESGKTERFEVKGTLMTVYIAVDSEEKRATLPDQWLVYGEDNQKFHLWDGTPDLIIGNDPIEPDPEDPTTPSLPDNEKLPGDTDTGVEEDPNKPNHGTKPSVPSLPDDPQAPKEPVKQSAKIGDIFFYALMGIIMVVCFFLLRKIQKDRGA